MDAVKQIFDDGGEHQKTIELTNKLDCVCEGYTNHQVKDALLTLLTWYIAASCGQNYEIYIDAVAFSLKESVKIQLLAEAETSKIPS